MTEKELKVIIAEGEEYRVEFKESMSNIDKEMVAFANASGGRLFIGISDDKAIKGIRVDNFLKSQVQDVANNCDPRVPIELEEFKNILIAHIKEGTDKPYRCSSGFYLRVGPNSQKLNRNEIVSFIKAEGKVRFDELEAKSFDPRMQLDRNKLQRFLKLAGIKSSLNPRTVMENLGVAERREGKFAVNNAGALFFSKNLNGLYTHTVVTCALYKGVEKVDILDRKDFNEDIVSSIDQAMFFLQRHLSLRYEITGAPRRREVLEIPEEALREAVINAVAHRDYFERGANVMVEILDDRVEISNPGGLVKGLTRATFGTKSILRNPTIASLLHRIRYIEKLGTGISRMRKALREVKLPAPQFHFDSFFTVALQRPMKKIAVSVGDSIVDALRAAIRDGVVDAVRDAVADGVRDAVRDAVGDAVDDAVKRRLAVGVLYLSQRSSITLETWKRMLNISRPTAQRDIAILKSLGWVVFRGAPRYGRYVSTKKAQRLFERLRKK